MSDLDEAELDALMARLSRGDRSAFATLFPELQQRAQRLARARLDQDAALDVAQSALLKVFSRASEFEAGRSALAWFYGIVANEVRSAQRVHRRLQPLGSEDMTSGELGAEEALITHELERALSGAVAELDPASADAIHALLGRAAKPPALQASAFRKRVSRAYARLRVLLGEWQ